MYNLMIVDDEYEIRTGLANYFPWEEIGFKVIFTANDGKEALEYILENPVDALLCDIKMPIMSGIDLARELCDRNIKIKTVFLSGFKEFEYAQKALIYGVRDYIVKPTKYNEIIEVFTKLKLEIDNEVNARNENNKIHKELAKDGLGNEVNTQENIIHYMKEYINKNYRSVTLEEIAKLVYMNPDYLSKFFKQKTGLNFSDYLSEICMTKAGEFLKNMDYKTYEVSIMVGYSNSHNFTRAFKKYYGMSPSEYRHGHFLNSINNSLKE